MKRFRVVIPMENGGVEVHPMKEWLRQHPDDVPIGLDPTSATSHRLRDGLLKLGWSAPETATEVHLMKPGYSQLETTVEAVLGEEGEGDDTEENVAAFVLEYQLRDFLAQNLSAIPVEGKRLRLYVDPTGRDGVEYPTAVGQIDILAIDDEEQFVVFELKRARSPDHAIGQLTRYMGWITQTIGRGKKVRGVIVAKSISENLRCSVTVVPNVSLFEYEVKFELKPASSHAL
ncbi:MAG: endonuclease NucS domain-containing protein [Sulfuricellaceae bacterium]